MSSFIIPLPPRRPPTRGKFRPTPLSIRTPCKQKTLLEVANEFKDNGRFDEALTRIQGWLREAVKSDNVQDVAYYSAAFRAFLQVKGGSYSLAPPLPHARATPGPPPPAADAADAVAAAALDPPAACVSSEPMDAMRNEVRLSAVDFTAFDG